MILAEGIGDEYMLGPEGVAVLGKALLIGLKAVGQVVDVERLGEKADAPIALLPQKGDRLEQDLMIVVCNIGRAGNGAAAVSQDDVDACGCCSRRFRR